jgi:hypothetical protein
VTANERRRLSPRRQINNIRQPTTSHARAQDIRRSGSIICVQSVILSEVPKKDGERDEEDVWSEGTEANEEDSENDTGAVKRGRSRKRTWGEVNGGWCGRQRYSGTLEILEGQTRSEYTRGKDWVNTSSIWWSAGSANDYRECDSAQVRMRWWIRSEDL